MTYLVKRTYGANVDYLYDWDEEFGTACGPDPRRALTFDSPDQADDAAEEANRVCYNRPDDMVFCRAPARQRQTAVSLAGQFDGRPYVIDAPDAHTARMEEVNHIFWIATGREFKS